MTTYGKCLTTVLKAKKELSPIFYEIYSKKELNHFDFSELKKLDKNSWSFFIESLIFFKEFFKGILLNKKNPFFLESAKPLYELLMKKMGTGLETFENEQYLKDLIEFSTQIQLKNISHYYIETESLFNFLTEIPVKSLKDMQDYIQTKESASTFCFHFPDNTGLSVILSIKNEILTAKMETEKGFFNLPKDENKILDSINTNKVLKLCFNAISYTSCFSDHVIDGVPRDSKDKPKKSENAKTLTPLKEIENFTKKDITAHFRHAHFRFCGSDYFKAKKGKWVFVKGSMVNAEAKTIIEDE